MPKMIKHFLLFLVFFCSWFLSNISHWANVEDVFSDISKDYIYYNELQTLYDKWMISSDSSWKFNPQRLLNRDEFVWISMEVTCKKCISPSTDFWLIQEYSTALTFYDVAKTNKYFYCIAEADDKWYVKWYDKWYTCENGDFDDERRPFCVDNKITLEEALAVVLRNSGIFTVEQNRTVIEQINAWNITEDLADDISPIGPNWIAYTFYWYFKEALEFELLEYDEKWEQKIYKLLELTNNKARPGQSISKEDFLIIAYIALKANSCVEEEYNELAVNIDIFDKTCSIGQVNCEKTKFPFWEETFDFSADVDWVCNLWVDDESGYTWKFYNIGTWNEVIKKGKYLDNYNFLEAWKWRVSLFVVDECGNIGEVYLTNIVQWDIVEDDWETSLWIQIEASPLRADISEQRNFRCIVDWWSSNDCSWDFWDWTSSNWINASHKYTKPWSYLVTATTTDSNWNTSTSTIIIVVTDDNISQEEEKETQLAADISVDPLYSKNWTSINLQALAEWWTGNYRYLWDYWDWKKWSGKDNTHIYEEPGDYVVKLTIIDTKLNRADSSTTVVIINEDWTDDTDSLWVDITVNPLIWDTDTKRNFEALVEWWDEDYTYIWDFWDNSTSTNSSESHLYDTPWVYDVTLTVTDWEWNEWTSTVTIVVNEEDIEINSLWVEINATPLEWWTVSVRFFEALVEWWDEDYTYIWDFWDNTTSTSQTITHLYDTPWTYTVEVTATDWEWNTWTSTVTIVVLEDDWTDDTNSLWVEIDASPLEWNSNTVRNFEALVEWWDEDYTYIWDFWDNSTSTNSSESHLYDTPWVYDVSLTVTDWEWNEWTSTVTIVVNEEDIEINSLWVEINATPLEWWTESVRFFEALVEWWDEDYTYIWDFWDNTTSTSQTITHLYDTPWTYTVEVTATDWEWNTWTSTVTIVVLEDDWTDDTNSLWVEIDASPLEWNSNTVRNFEALVEWWDEDYTYIWDFWDNSTSTNSSESHLYDTPWVYDVSLTVADWEWNEWTSTVTIVVENDNEVDNLNDLWVEIVATPLVWDTETVRNFDINVEWWDEDYTYVWDFWDNTTSTDSSDTNIYDTPWIYTVVVTVTDSEWNTWTDTVLILVTEDDWTDDTNSLWLNMNISPFIWWVDIVREFEGIAEWWNWEYTYEWDFWDDSPLSSDNNGKNTTHQYEESWTYTVTLTATDGEWNVSELTKLITIQDENNGWNIALAIEVQPNTSAFVWEEFSFISNVEWWDWDYTYEWFFDNWDFSEDKNSEYTYDTAWSYTVILQVTDWNWQTATVSVSVTVEEKKLALEWISVGITRDPSRLNIWSSVKFDSVVNHGWPTYSYNWDFGDWETSTEADPEHVYNIVWTHTVTLVVTDESWRSWENTTSIIVVNEEICIEWMDSDNDGITDCDNEDKCPLIPGSPLNEWCPTLELACNEDCSCSDWYTCSTTDPLQCWTNWVCKPERIVYNACLESWQTSLIYWNVSSCNSCPCLQSLDFNSNLRKCDVIFPAITSKDHTEIYSRWEIFNIK